MRTLRRLALALTAAVLVAFIAATVLVGAWLVLDRESALGDALSAWRGMVMITLAIGSPSAVLFGLVLAPFVDRAGRGHSGWGWLVGAAGGGAVVWMTTSARFAVFGVLGGLVYVALERFVGRGSREPTSATPTS